MGKAFFVVALLVAVVAPSTALARVATEASLVGDIAADCTQLVPRTDTADHVLAKGKKLPLDVLVFADGRDVNKADAAFALAAQAFERVGIDLNWHFHMTTVPDLGRETGPYLEWLKEQVGGTRPGGFDVVYLATSHRLYSNGQADCIGGVAYPAHAFAMGNLEWYGVVGVRVVGFEVLPQGPPLEDGGAKLVVHEIGHLLGGHHHYGPCAAPPSLEDPLHPCDVMNPVLVQQVGLHFGPLNAAVVRRNAQKYLRP